jgi:putative transcriptional regulator
MSVYESIMQGLTEAVDYQQGKIRARKTKLTIKPVDTFKTDEIKQIRQRTGLSQVMFAGSMGVSPKTVEAWENGRNKPEGASRRLLELVRDDPRFLQRFQACQNRVPGTAVRPGISAKMIKDIDGSAIKP